MTEASAGGNPKRRRLAIIGCGSSGLITLKMSLEFLPDWEIVCYEKSDSITGCWGDPYPGFVSTSTRYATQFACFPICGATVNDDSGASREEFFRNGEYGQYLESFADAFQLRTHIVLNHCVTQLQRSADGNWSLKANGSIEQFDSVVICTGLAAKPKPIDCDVPLLTPQQLNSHDGLQHVRGKKIVVLGGGESAVDYANRLAKRQLDNEVYLSLHSGVRVSPRYHPIRGVPSDFLRNRLMLSVAPGMRNWLGQIFVEARIKYQSQFEGFFPSRRSVPDAREVSSANIEDENQKRGSEWAHRLTLAAKDDLFNMFHNKSDDFLIAVGEQRIRIVGTPTDKTFCEFIPFDSAPGETIKLQPDALVPAIGYESTLSHLTNSTIRLTDFYLGCCHIDFLNLHMVGFARPIIGNIPTISEMQARYVCGMIAGEFPRHDNLNSAHQRDLLDLKARYSKLNLDAVYPVEMFPYCDRLARRMRLPIGPRAIRSPISWLRSRVAPASTLHYFPEDKAARDAFDSAPVYLPWSLILFIVLMKPIDWAYRVFNWIFRRGH